MKVELRKILLSAIIAAAMNSFATGQANTQTENQQAQAKAIESQLENRAKVIKYCMDILSTPIDMNSGDEQKIMAAYEQQRKALLTLGNLRAVEAAPLLAKIIIYNISGAESPNEAFVNTMFGCVPTLVKIGKPGAVECLRRIVNFTDEDWGNDMNITLLTLVIIRVEGEKYTRLIFEDFKTSLKDEKQIKNIERAIPYIDAARDLDGIIKDAYAKLKQEILTAEK